jgi:plastocyanin
MRKARVASALVAVALMGTAAGCGDDDSAGGQKAAGGASSDVVTIKTFQFAPKTLTVKAGTTVTFKNDDAINHTVTSGVRKGENMNTPDGTFDLKLANAGSTATYTFKKAGTFPYYCVIHPGQGMTGKVIVE